MPRIGSLLALYKYAKGRGKQEGISCLLYHISVQGQRLSFSLYSLITIVFKALLNPTAEAKAWPYSPASERTSAGRSYR